MNKKILVIKKSDKKDKRFVAEFFTTDDGELLKLIKKTHFGASNYSNYLIHRDDERKKRYIDRHKKNEDWNDYYSAGSLSRCILWGEKTLWKSIKKFAEKFNLFVVQKKFQIDLIEKAMRKQKINKSV